MSILAGADAGGTKTTAAIMVDGVEAARAIGAAGAVRPGRSLGAGSAIGATVRTALSQAGKLRADVLVVGAAGVGREEERVALRNALRLEDVAERITVVTDMEIAREAAFGAHPGIVLLAGTGSVATGRDPDGGLRRQGGYGWQMGDEGSGYALGRAALAAVGRMHDGRGTETDLSHVLLAQTRSGSFAELVRWSTTAGPGEVAGLARGVVEAAAGGDAAAVEILASEAKALARLVTVLAERWPGSDPVDVAQGGSLLLPGAYRDLVTIQLSANPRLRPHPGIPDGVAGALAIAARS